MGKLDPKAVPESRATRYPRRFQQHGGDITKRAFRRLGPHAGLTQFGVNLVRIEPGGMSSLRHWHTEEDEFVVMLSGELVLVTDEGEQLLCAGDLAAFPKNVPNGHHVLNRSRSDATFIVVGTNVDGDVAYYSDVDMLVGPGEAPFRTREGVAYDD